ncbi:Cytoplasmic GTPase/eEF2-like protein (ribosomal biogenesis), partial [Spiromyces aspiralis]
MGRELVLLDHVPAGNVFAVRGLAGAILRTGTLSSRLECHNFGALQSPSAPIVRVALEPALPQDMPKLERGMRLLYQADPCVQVEFKATGEHILVTAGELHLERCLKDLRERFAKCQIHASEPIVPFREAIIPQPGQPGVAKREARSLRDIGDINMLISENGNVPLAQRGVVTVTTPNGLATITLQVEPLPHAVTQLLMKHNATIRSIVNSEPLDASPASQATSGDVTKDITDHNTAADAPRSEAVSGA